MKHAAKYDDEKYTSQDDNASGMKNQWFDGAFCENVLQILDMTLPEPRFRQQCGSIWAGGHNGGWPPESSKKSVLKLLMTPYLNLDHRQRDTRPAAAPCGPQKLRFSLDCCYKCKIKEKSPS